MNATGLLELNGKFYYGDEIIANIAIVHDTKVTNIVVPTGSLRKLRQFNIATIHNYYPQGSANIDTMMESLVADAAKPVALTIEPSMQAVASSSHECARSVKMFGAARADALSPMLPQQKPQHFAQPAVAHSAVVMSASDGTRVSVGIAPPKQ